MIVRSSQDFCMIVWDKKRTAIVGSPQEVIHDCRLHVPQSVYDFRSAIFPTLF